MVVTFIEETESSLTPVAFLDAVAYIRDKTVRRHICGVTEFRSIGTVDIVCHRIVCGSNLVSDSIRYRLRTAMGIGGHQGQTEVEVFLELCGHRIVVTVDRAVGNIIWGDVVIHRVGEAVEFPVFARHWLSFKLDAALDLMHAEKVHAYRRQFVAVDSFQRSLDAAREPSVQCEGSLPCGRHDEILVHDGRLGRSRKILCREGSAVHIFEYIVYIVMETRGVGSRTGSVDILGLEAVAVSCRRNDPYERKAACEDTRTSTQNERAVAEYIPVETYARRHIQACLRHVRS